MSPSSNQHYELHDLVDYVRKTGSPERLAAMQRHLEVEGCEVCRRSANMLAEAYGAARVLAQVDVPTAVTQRARVIFSAKPVAVPSRWQNLPAVAVQLLSGGLLEPSPAGLRSASASRQKVYSAGSAQVRVLQERTPEGAIALVGALTDMADLSRSYAGCPVLLVARDEVLATTKTSRFGEFHLQVSPAPGLRLVVLIEGGSRRVEIEVDRTTR